MLGQLVYSVLYFLFSLVIFVLPVRSTILVSSYSVSSYPQASNFYSRLFNKRSNYMIVNNIIPISFMLLTTQARFHYGTMVLYEYVVHAQSYLLYI